MELIVKACSAWVALLVHCALQPDRPIVHVWYVGLGGFQLH